MDKREKVIKCLEICVSNSFECSLQCPYAAPISGGFCYDNLMRDALELLKERESEETRLVRHYSRPNVYADLWLHCEKCGGKIDDRYRPKYCPCCGRKVKWNE